MATYRSTEERKENLDKYNPAELKEKILTLYGSNPKVDKVIWELVPNYFKIKLPHLEILSIHLKTNEVVSEIKVSVFLVNILSIEILSKIVDIFDLINLSVNNDWEPYSFMKENTDILYKGRELHKYTFTSLNLSNKNFATENIFIFNSF